MSHMPTLDLWRWRLRGPDGRRMTTRHVMTPAEARALDPAAEPVPGSLERREVPDDPALLVTRITGGDWPGPGGGGG